MTRTFFAFATFLLASATSAVPAPNLSGWGKSVDPDKDCKINRSRDTLTIEMPGAEHDYDPIRKCFNAPRLLRDIEGNFDLRVRVRIDCRPSARSTVKGQLSCVSAGILLIYPDTYSSICERFEFGLSQPAFGQAGAAFAPQLLLPRRDQAARKAIGEDGYVANKTFWCRERSDNGKRDLESLVLTQTICDPGWLGWPLSRKTDQAYLRLEQSDRRLTFFISPDGERWAFLVHGPHPPTKLKLGLAAYSTSSKPSKVKFDQLKLTRVKKDKR